MLMKFSKAQSSSAVLVVGGVVRGPICSFMNAVQVSVSPWLVTGGSDGSIVMSENRE